MASSEERMMILRMVEEGKITPEEGARLLAATGEREAAAETVGATQAQLPAGQPATTPARTGPAPVTATALPIAETLAAPAHQAA